MVDYNNLITPEGVTRTEITGAEKIQLEADRKAFADKSADRKLIQIKEIRLEKLKATDYMANSDITMPDYIKTWRQTLRDLPQNNTTESQYNTLLERNADGSLKHSVWKQPTS